MRLLKENYEGLREIDGLSPKLRKLLSEPKIQEALQKSDFDTLYKKLQKTENYDTIGNFTQLLISSNIDPLSYLDSMPIAFLTHTPVKSIDIPNHITNISDWAFCGCESLASITIPDSVTSIGEYAFNYCTSLESIIIPNSVTSIDQGAFQDSKGLASITIPDSVASIIHNAFTDCDKLQNIYITDIAAWCNISGLNYLMGEGASNKKLYINNELITSITIPDGVTSIPDYALRGCDSLTSITIPDSVTSIGWSAFRGCSGLINVTIPSSVGAIGGYAFYTCSKLSNIKYTGTKNQWLKINHGYRWNEGSPIKTIHCTDGDITL